MELKFFFRRRANRQLRAVVQQNVESLDVIDSFTSEQGMSAAGVIPDHSAERASAMRRGIGAKRQMVKFGALAQAV